MGGPGSFLPRLMNNLQPGSVPKINRSMQNWHQVRSWPIDSGGAPPSPCVQQGSPPFPASSQLENLSNFIKAMVGYGMNPVDLFEANDLFESGNMTQVQVSLLALAGKVRSREGWWAAQSHTARRTRQTQAGPPKSHCLMWEAGRREKLESLVERWLGYGKSM